jgi:hypothetical protein
VAKNIPTSTIKPTVRYSRIALANSLSSSLVWPRPRSMYTPLVKKSEPTTTVTGQKNITTTSSVNINPETVDITKIILSNFFSSSIDQKPCKNNRKEVRKTRGAETNRLCLSDNIASNNKNDVTSVNTNPTPLAALKRAIVFEEETVYIFIVDNKT